MKQQAAVIPFRANGKKIEVCLIRRKGTKKKWGIPKGFVDRGETAKEAALKEALEEAGLEGRLVGDAIGTYEYKKWGLDLSVSVYVMKVGAENDDWEEAEWRERRWVPFKEADEMLDGHPARELLSRASEVMR